MSEDSNDRSLSLDNDYDSIIENIQKFLKELGSVDLNENNFISFISPVLSMYKANRLIESLDDHKIYDIFSEISLYLKNKSCFVFAVKLDNESLLVRFDPIDKQIYKLSFASSKELSYKLMEDDILRRKLQDVSMKHSIFIAEITTKHLSGI
jgi:hypothetical protein